MKKKGTPVKNFIKGLLTLFVSIACKILSSFMSAKAVTAKEKVLIDHLNGNYDSPLKVIILFISVIGVKDRGIPFTFL